MRYGDPSEFHIPPLPPLVDNPERGFSIGRSDLRSAQFALTGVTDAISKYPISIIQKNLTALFISGTIKTHGVEIGGSYFDSWIYLSAIDEYLRSSPDLYAESFHHEFSSLLLNNGIFPRDQWQAVNDANFKYLVRQIDVIKEAASESRREPNEAPSWYRVGFIDDYGMSDMENDFNTYAVMAMTQSQKLKKPWSSFSKKVSGH